MRDDEIENPYKNETAAEVLAEVKLRGRSCPCSYGNEDPPCLRCRLAAAVRRLATWQPGDTAPKTGECFLAVTVLGEPAVMHWYNGKWWRGHEWAQEAIEEPAVWLRVVWPETKHNGTMEGVTA